MLLGKKAMIFAMGLGAGVGITLLASATITGRDTGGTRDTTAPTPVFSVARELADLRDASERGDIHAAARCVVRIGTFNPRDPQEADDVYRQLFAVSHGPLADKPIPDGIDWEACSIPPGLRPASWRKRGIGKRRITFGLFVWEAMDRVQSDPAIWLRALDRSDELAWNCSVIEQATMTRQPDIAAWALIGLGTLGPANAKAQEAFYKASVVLGPRQCSRGILRPNEGPPVLGSREVTGKYTRRSTVGDLINAILTEAPEAKRGEKGQKP